VGVSDPVKKIDAFIAQEVDGWVWQPVPWMNEEQSVLVPFPDYVKEGDGRIRLGDDVYKFLQGYDVSTTNRLLALILMELRAQRSESPDAS
jgi:hypothetical protein